MRTTKEYVIRKHFNENGNLVYLETENDLVRCKDCKYFINSNEQCQLIATRLHFYEREKRWTEDSFCSWAERKEKDGK